MVDLAKWVPVLFALKAAAVVGGDVGDGDDQVEDDEFVAETMPAA